MAVMAYGKSVQTYTAWAGNTAYELEDYRVPTVDNGMCYECTTAGTSDNTEGGPIEPTWPNVAEQTVVDGTVTWTCREKAAADAALTVTLDITETGGFNLKDVWVKSDDEVTFHIYGSWDGVNWRPIDTLDVPNGELASNHKTYTTAYPHIGVGTQTVAANEIEIVAGK